MSSRSMSFRDAVILAQRAIRLEDALYDGDVEAALKAYEMLADKIEYAIECASIDGQWQRRWDETGLSGELCRQWK